MASYDDRSESPFVAVEEDLHAAAEAEPAHDGVAEEDDVVEEHITVEDEDLSGRAADRSPTGRPPKSARGKPLTSQMAVPAAKSAKTQLAQSPEKRRMLGSQMSTLPSSPLPGPLLSPRKAELDHRATRSIPAKPPSSMGVLPRSPAGSHSVGGRHFDVMSGYADEVVEDDVLDDEARSARYGSSRPGSGAASAPMPPRSYAHRDFAPIQLADRRAQGTHSHLSPRISTPTDGAPRTLVSRESDSGVELELLFDGGPGRRRLSSLAGSDGAGFGPSSRATTSRERLGRSPRGLGATEASTPTSEYGFDLDLDPDCSQPQRPDSAPSLISLHMSSEALLKATIEEAEEEAGAEAAMAAAVQGATVEAEAAGAGAAAAVGSWAASCATSADAQSSTCAHVR
mmetsp:Transcript_19820/g.46504  ORF Transcript_19820/g.46504 Transcript_19820/m.46504 type:complete len:399 (+) Transcript_19820:61-1257(+)